RLSEALEVSKAAAPLSVLDLAAGSGVWSVALALRSPHVRVTAVDWPGVIPITHKGTARFGVADRFGFVAGDLLEANFGSGHAIATAGIFCTARAKRAAACCSKRPSMRSRQEGRWRSPRSWSTPTVPRLCRR